MRSAMRHRTTRWITRACGRGSGAGRTTPSAWSSGCRTGCVTTIISRAPTNPTSSRTPTTGTPTAATSWCRSTTRAAVLYPMTGGTSGPISRAVISPAPARSITRPCIRNGWLSSRRTGTSVTPRSPTNRPSGRSDRASTPPGTPTIKPTRPRSRRTGPTSVIVAKPMRRVMRRARTIRAPPRPLGGLRRRREITGHRMGRTVILAQTVRARPPTRGRKVRTRVQFRADPPRVTIQVGGTR